VFLNYKRRSALQAAFFVFIAHIPVLAQDDLAAESHHAKELMADHRFAEAIPIYEKLVKALPGNVGLLLNLGMAEEMAGHPSQAIGPLEAVLKAQPDAVPALVSLSMARLQLNQSREALAPLRKLVALDPKDSNAIGMLADAEMSQSLFEDSAAHYRQLTAQTPADPRAWFGLGKAYESLATRAFERLNKAAPESPYIAVLLADTRLQRKQYRSAFFFYKEAQRKLPDLPGIYAGLAAVYLNTDHKDWADVEQQHEKALPAPDCKTQPNECAFLSGHYLEAAKAPSQNAAALFWATRAYNQLAGDAFEHLSQLPESVQIHALKAQTLSDHRQPMEAANEWLAALKLAPDDPKLKREYANALFNAKDYQTAIPLLQAQIEQDPNDPDLNYLLGTSLFRTEQAEKALPHLETVTKSHPEILPADAALGLTLVALNRNADAIPYLKKSLALDDDGSLHYSLARAYRAAGDTQQATDAMQQYQKIQAQNQQINDQLAKEAEIAAP
jgi:predicted Zn-dependent protease